MGTFLISEFPDASQGLTLQATFPRVADLGLHKRLHLAAVEAGGYSPAKRLCAQLKLGRFDY